MSSTYPVFKDAYTREQFIDMIVSRHGFTLSNAAEAFDKAVRDEQLEVWTAADIWALPVRLRFEGELYVPKSDVEYQVILPRMTWEIGSLRAWFARGFDRVWMLVEVPEAETRKRRYIRPISRIGALMALSEVRPLMRWLRERYYRFTVDRFSTGFAIDQVIVLRYTTWIEIPPEVKMYVGSIRWCCGYKVTKDKYRFIREISVWAYVPVTVEDIDDYFMKLLECVLEELNYPKGEAPDYPRLRYIMENWSAECLWGELARIFEVSEVVEEEEAHESGDWEYVQYDSDDLEQMYVVNSGKIDVDECLKRYE